MGEPTYKLEKLNFDGPLDLLLQLIEKNKVDIYDIPIVEITAQYFAYVRELPKEDLDVISDFLVMASTLLDIKARMLLPEEEKPGEEAGDPREELVARLLQYKQYKFIAHELDFYEEYAARFLYREEELPAELKEYVPPVDLDRLLEGVTAEMLKNVYLKVLSRMTAARNVPQEGFGKIKRERISLARCIRSMVRYASRHRKFSFRQMLENGADKTEVVVSFLAVLELIRMGKVTAIQEKMGDDIEVQVEENANLEEIDLSDIEDA